MFVVQVVWTPQPWKVEFSEKIENAEKRTFLQVQPSMNAGQELSMKPTAKYPNFSMAS